MLGGGGKSSCIRFGAEHRMLMISFWSITRTCVVLYLRFCNYPSQVYDVYSTLSIRRTCLLACTWCGRCTLRYILTDLSKRPCAVHKTPANR